MTIKQVWDVYYGITKSLVSPLTNQSTKNPTLKDTNDLNILDNPNNGDISVIQIQNMFSMEVPTVLEQH